MDNDVQEIPNVGDKAKKAPKVMNGSPPMSAIMLKGLAEVAAKGVRTDKGFKEADKMKVTKALTAFVGYDVTKTQAHNHLCWDLW